MFSDRLLTGSFVRNENVTRGTASADVIIFVVVVRQDCHVQDGHCEVAEKRRVRGDQVKTISHQSNKLTKSFSRRGVRQIICPPFNVC